MRRRRRRRRLHSRNACVAASFSHVRSIWGAYCSVVRHRFFRCVSLDVRSLAFPFRSVASEVRGPCAADALPFDDGSTDLVVVTLAAHEIRHPQRRESLFKEIARIVAPDGRVVVVEHLRNLSAALAFGPGLFHFYPRGEWVRLARAARLTIAEEFHITPFVHVFVLRNR